jgi:hypothetical protein
MTNRRETNKWITTLGSRVHLHRPAHGDVREQRAAAIWHQQCGSLSCGITLHRDTQRGLSRRRRGGAQHFALGQAPRGALRHLLSRAPSERQNARKKDNLAVGDLQARLQHRRPRSLRSVSCVARMGTRGHAVYVARHAQGLGSMRMHLYQQPRAPIRLPLLCETAMRRRVPCGVF